MIQVDHLTKTFKIGKRPEGPLRGLRSLLKPEYEERLAVNDISFCIDDGEIVGYIGPNGAGKSTTIKMLAGILTPTAGTVRVDGLDPVQDREAHTRHIGVVFGQKTSLWWDTPVMDSFLLLKEMYDVDDARFHKNLDLYTDLLDMSGFLDQPVRQLSLGQRMRADLAAALLHDPSILFLDEPTIGVDVVAKEALRQFIREINRERGVTVLLTTHDAMDMDKIADRVLVIDKGRLIHDSTMQELKIRYGGEDAEEVIRNIYAGKEL